MKTLGMIGGMSWESTSEYYRLINQGVKRECGGLHSAKILLHSVDFSEIEELQKQARWQESGNILGDCAEGLERAGADYIMICTNTMHKVADQVAARVSIPMIHIADATAEKIVEEGVSRVGLLGTGFTMEEEFYRGRLTNLFDLQVLIPGKADRDIVHDIIYRELCLGRIKEHSRRQYQRIARSLAEQGAEAVILGCTEISLLLHPEDIELTLYDTTAIHAEKAVQLITQE
jgi:aspartate racemase